MPPAKFPACCLMLSLACAFVGERAAIPRTVLSAVTADGIVTTIATGAVATAKIADAAVTRAKLTNPVFVNVRDFGATGDGVTDDTAAINAAIDHIRTIGVADLGGATLFIPGGRYQVTSIDATQLAQYAVEIVGEGRGPGAGTRIFGTANNKIVLDMVGSGRCRVSNLTIGSDAGITPTAGIVLSASTTEAGSEMVLDRLYISGSWAAAGLYVFAASEGSYHSVHVANVNAAGKAAIKLTDDNDDAVASDFTTIQGSGVAIGLRRPAGHTFIRCESHDGSAHADGRDLVLRGAYHVTWNGVLTNSGTAAANVEFSSACAHILFVNSSFGAEAGTVSGICLRAAAGVTVTGVKLDHCALQFAISLFGGGGTFDGVTLDSLSLNGVGTALVPSGTVLLGGSANRHITGHSTVATQVAANKTVYIGPPGHQELTDFQVSHILTQRALVQTLRVVADIAPGAGQTYVVTVLVNGSPTGITATVSGASATSATDLTNFSLGAAGDRISLQVVTSATAAAARFTCSLGVLHY